MAMKECVDTTKHFNILANTQFIETIVEEKRKLEELHMQEIQSTVENPRIRERYDTTNICKEYSAQKQQEILERSRRIQLRENEPELRHLMYELRKANVCRLQMEQIQDQKDFEKIEDQRRLIEEMDFLNEQACDEELIKKKQIAQQQQRRDLRDALLKQINDSKKLKKKIHEETISEERLAIKELLASLKEERMAKLGTAAIRSEKYRHLLEQADQEIQKRKTAEFLEKMTKYDCFESFMGREQPINTVSKNKRNQLRYRQTISEAMGVHVLELTTEKRRRQDLLTDLLVAERLAKEELREYHEKEKKWRDKMLLNLEYEYYKEDTLARRKALKKAEEEEWHRYQAEAHAKYEVDDIEEKQRKLSKEKKCNFLEMIRLKERKKMRQKNIDLIEDQMLLHAECQKQNEIDIERLHLLAQEPIESLRCLPSGLLHDYEEKALNVKSN